MAEPRPFEDEATLYVLGRLGRAKRRRFEARLKTSPELRILVRDLEAGTVVLAIAMPEHQPPPQMWDRIHDAVAHEAERKVVARSFLFALFRSGWAAAACIMIGWLIYALWVLDSHEMSPAILSGELSQSDPEPRGVAGAEAARHLPEPRGPINVAPAPGTTPLVRAGDVAALRREIRDLEDQLAHMSQVLTQQQTFPSSPGQLAFFHLVPTSGDGTTARAVKPPSPELQRALLLGMERELGWLRPSTATPPANAEKQSEPESQESEAAEAADLGVKFVDLPTEPGGQPAAASPIGKEEAKKLKSILAETPTAPAETATPNLSETATPDESAMPTESTIPAFRSGTNLVLAIDSSVVPSLGTNAVTVWTAPRPAPFQIRGWARNDWPPAMASVNGTGSTLSALGTFTVGNAPTLLTIPLGSPSAGAPGTLIFTVGGSPNGPFTGPVMYFSPSP